MYRSITREGRLVPLLLVLALLFWAQSAAFAQEDEEEFSQTAPGNAVEDDTRKAIEAFNAGQDAHEAGDLDKALEQYTEALRLFPEFPEAEFQVGSILESRGDLVRAEGSYRRALEYRPGWTLPMATLGSLLAAKGAYDEAGSILAKALEIDGMCIPCYPPLTEVYLRTGAGPEVLKTHLQKLTILTSKAKTPASVWAAKASVERSTGDLEAARESVRRALMLDPESPAALAERIELLLAAGDAEGASASARKLLETRPDSAAAKMQLARAEHLAGRSAAAISILEPVAPLSSEAAKLLALIKADTEDDPSGLEKMLEADPENAAILGRLCSATRKTAPEKSLDYCLKASRAEPGNINHAIGYAGALLQMNKNAEAAALLSRLKQNFPDNYTVRANLAFALFRLDRFEEARAEYEWITEAQPGMAAGYYFLAICYDRLERYTDALANYQKFLRLADKDSFADEISRVELRLPILQRQIKEGKGKT